MLTRLHASISTSSEACAAATSRAWSAILRPRGVASSNTTTAHASSTPLADHSEDSTVLALSGVSSSPGKVADKLASGRTGNWGSIIGEKGIVGSSGVPGGELSDLSSWSVASLTLLWFSGKLMLHSLSKRN